MGKLIILSGPSGVGKGPLVKTLEIYLESIGKRLKRHVLYTTRKIREETGEVHGETYWYSYLMNVSVSNHNTTNYKRSDAETELERICQEAKDKCEEFLKFSVRTEQNQGINLSELEFM